MTSLIYLVISNINLNSLNILSKLQPRSTKTLEGNSPHSLTYDLTHLFVYEHQQHQLNSLNILSKLQSRSTKTLEGNSPHSLTYDLTYLVISISNINLNSLNILSKLQPRSTKTHPLEHTHKHQLHQLNSLAKVMQNY